MPSRTALAIAVLWLAAPAAATAGEDASRSEPSVRLMGNMGVASAVGEVGGTFTYAPWSELEIELGAGLGFSGLQLSLMPKVSLGSRPHRLALGLGPSVGIGGNRNPPDTCVAYWLNAEVGYEYRSPSGFSLLLAVGVGKGLGGTMPGAPAPGRDSADASPPQFVAQRSLFPQGRIALGRWF